MHVYSYSCLKGLGDRFKLTILIELLFLGVRPQTAPTPRQVYISCNTRTPR